MGTYLHVFVHARGQHWSIMCTYCVCNAEFSVLGPKCPVGEAKPRQNTRNPAVGCPGPLWHCRGVQNHDSDTGDVARGQHWSTTCMHSVRKAEFLLLGPKYPVGAAKPRQNTSNPDLALQGPFGTAVCRQTMTTTPETSLEVNARQHHASIACAKPSFQSLAPNGHDGAAKPRQSRAI